MEALADLEQKNPDEEIGLAFDYLQSPRERARAVEKLRLVYRIRGDNLPAIKAALSNSNRHLAQKIAYILHYDLGETSQAIDLLESVRSNTAPNPKTQFLLSVMYLRQGDKEKAIANLEQAEEYISSRAKLRKEHCLDQLICRAAIDTNSDPLRAAEEFDISLKRLFEGELKCTFSSFLMLDLFKELLYYNAFKAIAAQLGLFDGTVGTSDRPKMDDFKPKNKREEELMKKLRKAHINFLHSSHSFDHALKLFQSYGLSPKKGPGFYPTRAGGDAYVLDTSDSVGLEDVVGRVVFRKAAFYPDSYMTLMSFYKGLIGLKKLAPPVATAPCPDAYYFLIPYGTVDLEAMLNDPYEDPYLKFFSLALDLATHAELQRKLEPYTTKTNAGCSLKVTSHWMHAGDFTFDVEMPVHDYQRELEESMVVGRDSDAKPRLARAKEYSYKINGARSYYPGSNPAIDNLIAEGNNFASSFLITPELDGLCMGLVDHDAQPSNYLKDGKLIDLTKIKWGNAVYTAARLLGHPSAARFLEQLNPEQAKQFYESFVLDSEGEVRESADFLEAHPEIIQNSDYFFSLYIARRVIDSAIPVDEINFDRLYESYYSHKAWINAFHVFSHECRAQDTGLALAHLETALHQLKQQPAYAPFLSAYIVAIMQSEHAPFQEFIAKNHAALLP